MLCNDFYCLTVSLLLVCLVSVKRRQEQILDAFTARKSKSGANSPTPLTIFVKKLQESLTRMESCEVVTVAQGTDGKLSHYRIIQLADS